MRNILLLTIAVFCLAFKSSSQTVVTSFKLINGKTIEIVNCIPTNYLEFTTRRFDINNGFSTRYLQGEIRLITDSSIVIAPRIDHIVNEFSSDSIQYIDKNFKKPHYTVNLEFKKIEIINYHSRIAQNWQGIGFSSIIIGGLTALIVAPLVSINYKSGGFNSTTYFTCAGIGLGILTIGIPLSVLNKEKEYFINQPDEGKKQIIWRFK